MKFMIKNNPSVSDVKILRMRMLINEFFSSQFSYVALWKQSPSVKDLKKGK